MIYSLGVLGRSWSLLVALGYSWLLLGFWRPKFKTPRLKRRNWGELQCLAQKVPGMPTVAKWGEVKEEWNLVPSGPPIHLS